MSRWFAGGVRGSARGDQHAVTVLTEVEIAAKFGPAPQLPAGVFAFRDIVLQILKLVHRCAKLCSLPYWLDSGTLVGVVRGPGAFIPWDTDGDIGILAAHRIHWGRCFERAVDERHLIVTDGISVVSRTGRNADILPIKLVHRATGVYVDVIMFESGVGGEVFLPHVADLPHDRGTTQRWKEDIIFPLAECLLEGIRLWCPRQSREYCMGWYSSIAVPPGRQAVWGAYLLGPRHVHLQNGSRAALEQRSADNSRGATRAPLAELLPRVAAVATLPSAIPIRGDPTNGVSSTPVCIPVYSREDKAWVHSKRFLLPDPTEQHKVPRLSQEFCQSLLASTNGLEIDVVAHGGRLVVSHELNAMDFPVIDGVKGMPLSQLFKILKAGSPPSKWAQKYFWIDLKSRHTVSSAAALLAALSEAGVLSRTVIEYGEADLAVVQKELTARGAHTQLTVWGNRLGPVALAAVKTGEICNLAGHIRDVAQLVDQFPATNFHVWPTSKGPGHTGWPGALGHWVCKPNVRIVLINPMDKYDDKGAVRFNKTKGVRCAHESAIDAARP